MLDKSSHDTISRLNTKGKRGNIEAKKIFSLLRDNTGLNGSQDGSTICDGLISVDDHAGLLAVKVVGNEFDYTGNAGGATDQDDFMDVRLVDLRVTEDLFNRFQSVRKEILANFLETGTCYRGIEVDTLEK